jgi:hypothetical protein
MLGLGLKVELDVGGFSRTVGGITDHIIIVNCAGWFFAVINHETVLMDFSGRSPFIGLVFFRLGFSSGLNIVLIYWIFQIDSSVFKITTGFSVSTFALSGSPLFSYNLKFSSRR